MAIKQYIQFDTFDEKQKTMFAKQSIESLLKQFSLFKQKDSAYCLINLKVLLPILR